MLGHARLPHRRAVIGFAESLALLAEAALFVLLGLLASPARLPSALVDALVIGAAATFVARPLAVALCALPFDFSWREQVFVSWAGLRGAVPIVVATIPVTAGIAGGERVVDVVFVLVVVYTLVQAPTLPFLGRLLRVVDRSLPTDLEVEAAPLEQVGADLLQLRIGERSRLAGVYVGELRLPVGRARDARRARGPQRRCPAPTRSCAAATRCSSWSPGARGPTPSGGCAPWPGTASSPTGTPAPSRGRSSAGRPARRTDPPRAAGGAGRGRAGRQGHQEGPP